MYQFSRSIYRELAAHVIEDRHGWPGGNRTAFLRACESALERLAADRRYFARPARTLFRDVRIFFPMAEQARVLEVIERHMGLAAEFVDRQAEAGLTVDGRPLCCRATTRRGTACQRLPLAGSEYCPSHRHLDEAFEAATAA